MSHSRSKDFKRRGQGITRGGTRANAKVRLQRQAASSQRRAQTQFARVNMRSAGLLGIEKKFYDTSYGSTAVTVGNTYAGCEADPSATSMISTPPQGDTASSRDGKRCVIKTVQVKGTVSVDASANLTAGENSTRVFIALVHDSQSNGAQLNAEDVFINPSASTYAVCTPLRNLLHGSRFRILKSELISLDQVAMAYDGTNMETAGISKSFDWFVSLGEGMAVNFNSGTSASIANVVDNSLHIIACASANDPNLAYNARIRFVG